MISQIVTTMVEHKILYKSILISDNFFNDFQGALREPFGWGMELPALKDE